MIDKPLLVIDFDGVIVDGLKEYWLSSRQTCLNILSPQKKENIDWPSEIPSTFQAMRPWVHHGWEMVLLAAECTHQNSYLHRVGVTNFCNNYTASCKEALKEWEFQPKILQKALDEARREEILNNFEHWLSCHKDFPGVIKYNDCLTYEEIIKKSSTEKSLLFKFQKLMAISHDGVIDRAYTNLVKNYDVEENINKTAKSISELILKKQEVTFSKT